MDIKNLDYWRVRLRQQTIEGRDIDLHYKNIELSTLPLQLPHRGLLAWIYFSKVKGQERLPLVINISFPRRFGEIRS